MTPKEKAKELIDKFQFETKESELLNRVIIGDISVRFSMHMAKKSALIAVDEIIKSNPHSNPFNTDVYSTMGYWQKVKHELNKSE